MRKTLAIAAMLLAACSLERSAMPVIDPSANSIRQTDIEAVVGAALAHPSVSQYLHPEVRGRLPVTVAFRSPKGLSSLDATLFGRPVRVVAATQDVPAVILAVSINGDHATVALDYPPEGMAGTFGFAGAAA